MNTNEVVGAVQHALVLIPALDHERVQPRVVPDPHLELLALEIGGLVPVRVGLSLSGDRAEVKPAERVLLPKHIHATEIAPLNRFDDE